MYKLNCGFAFTIFRKKVPLSVKNKNLPRVYSMPKLHKNPHKFPFIACSKFCSTKELSVMLTKGLQRVQQLWYNYCSQIEAILGIKR